MRWPDRSKWVHVYVDGKYRMCFPQVEGQTKSEALYLLRGLFAGARRFNLKGWVN